MKQKIFYLASLLWTLGTLTATKGQVIKLEAETGTLYGLTVSTETPGYSGAGYVSGFINSAQRDSISFNVTTPGLYELTLTYNAPYGPKNYDFTVNDENGSGAMLTTVGVVPPFLVSNAGKVFLNQGTNFIVIRSGWGYYNVDFVTFTPTSVALPVKPPKTLVNANATCAARALQSYLVDIYGTKVLTGQQDLSEINYIKDSTGKTAAVGSFDLIDYSPTRRFFEPNKVLTTSEDAINWQKTNNTIVSLMWHWNAPTKLKNNHPDTLWWRGFYTYATRFYLDSALADTNSNDYRLLISDMDTIALQLKKFRDADIPVLWRPLHEAAGGWFWWGRDKKAAPFIALWRLMYNRLTNYHKLHNLIWVYTSEPDLNWYPGDAYVDIVGVDIYGPFRSSLNGRWAGLQAAFGGKKLVALSESGNLPVPEKVRAFGTWWSWFAAWVGPNYIRRQPKADLIAAFTDPDFITADELPNWRANCITAVDEKVETKSIVVYPNPFYHTLTIDQENFQYRIVDLSGNELEHGSGKKGTEIGSTLMSGMYILKISSENGDSNVKITKL